MSSSPLIPRDQVKDYAFWKLDDFQARAEPRGDLPTVAELERIREQARAEGYAAGYGEGRQQALAEAERIHALLEDLTRELNRFDQGVGENLVALALEVARQVVRANVAQRPELVLGIVREAMEALPPFSEHARLAVHPEDAALVRSHLGEQLTHAKWRVFEDAAVERGGCRVETASMQIDGTLATRWQRAIAALGQTESWLRTESGDDGAAS